ncbi:hypothetical protein VPH35_026430 [Triticum aestivum]
MLARAARSAAAAASRFARFHEPAALSLSLSTKAESHAPASSDCTASGHSAAVAVAVPPPVTAAPASPTVRHLKDQKPEGSRVKFMAEEKDLESDEALWALYERWCKAFDQERDREEMARRFDTFKKTVLDVQDINKAYPSHKPRTITKFADGKLRRPCCSRDPFLKRIAEELDDNPCELIVGDDNKLYKRVFADYKVVDDRLYVHLPKGIDVKTITTNPEWPTSEC